MPGSRTSTRSRRRTYGPQPAPAGPVPAAWAGRGRWRRRRRPGGAAQARRRRARPSPRRPAPPPTAAPGVPAGSASLVVGHRRHRRWSWSSLRGRRRSRRAADRGHDLAVPRLRAIPSWQVTLGVALLALGFLDRRPARVRGPARPLHDPGADAAGRDGQRAAERSRTGSRHGSSTCARRSRTSRARARARRDLVRQLNDQLEQARIAAGLIALTGTGIVLQLEDSKQPVPPDGSESDYLVGSRDIRAVVEELWGAGAEAIAVNGERITPTSAIIDVGTSLLVNSAYLDAAVPDHGPRTARPVRPAQRVGRVRRLRALAQRGLRHPRLARRAASRSTCRPSSGR